jgi:hypothetical protein
VGRIKGLLSRHIYSKGRAGKQLFARLKKGKRQPAREKAPWIKKERMLTLNCGVLLQKGGVMAMTI